MSELEKTSNATGEVGGKTRRWFSFSLRTMLIFFAVVASLLHFWIIPSERQRKEYHKILSEGGNCGFKGMDLGDHFSGLMSVVISAYYPPPEKVKWYHHYIYPVDSISLAMPHEFHPDFSMHRVRSLVITGDWNTNSLLKNELLINNIAELGIQNKSVNYETIQTLSRYKKLNTLVISNKILECTDDELLMFSRFPQLKVLDISAFLAGSGRRPGWTEKVVQEKKKRKQMLIEALKKNISKVKIEYTEVQFRD